MTKGDISQSLLLEGVQGLDAAIVVAVELCSGSWSLRVGRGLWYLLEVLVMTAGIL